MASTSRRGRALDAAAFIIIAATLTWTCLHVWVPGRGFVTYRPEVVSGDEPHYLMLVHSLLQDGDLELQRDYERVAAGEARAGRQLRGAQLDHHTWVVDVGGDRALWSDLYDWRHPQPCGADAVGCVPFRRLDDRLPPSSASRRERPAHPPALAAIWALLLWPLALPAADVETVAVLLNLPVVLLTLLATARLAAAAGLGPWGCRLAVVLLLCSPLPAYARGLFTEPLAALSLAMGTERWLRRRPTQSALWLALALWLKPPWLLFALALAAAAWRRQEPLMLRRFALPYGVAALALVGLNVALVGGPLISGQLGWRWVDGPAQLLRTWIDGKHGLLAFVPWVVLASPALRLRLRRGRDAGATLADATPALLALAALLMCFGSLGEICFGPRLWLPVLPLLAVAAVVGATGPVHRRWLVMTAAWGALAAAPGVLSWPVSWEQPAWLLLRQAIGRWLGT